MLVKEIEAVELAQRLASDCAPLIIDVREPWEVELAGFDAAVNMPMDTVPDRLQQIRDSLRPDQTVAVLCRSGARSRQVAAYLQQNGIAAVVNVAGGILAWAADVDPEMPTY